MTYVLGAVIILGLGYGAYWFYKQARTPPATGTGPGTGDKHPPTKQN